MEVKDGDVLVCACENCDIELTVKRTCSGDSCAHDSECELTVMCCGEPMEVRSS